MTGIQRYLEAVDEYIDVFMCANDTAACGHSYYVTASSEAGESAASAASYFGMGRR